MGDIHPVDVALRRTPTTGTAERIGEIFRTTTACRLPRTGTRGNLRA